MVLSMTPDEIAAMTPNNHKVYENRLRRMASRQGLELRKHKVRDPRAINHGTYGLSDAGTSAVTHGGPDGYGLGLDQVERILTGTTA